MNQSQSSRTVGRQRVATICRRLRRTHGCVEPPPQGPVLDELIATILSQNTSDANSGAAFEELRRRFPDWEAVRRAPAARVAQAIRQAGLSNIKTPRLQTILDQIQRERGQLSLEFLHDLSTPDAVAYLSGFRGVGPKTVACVLLFACRKPILPVDTHVLRVSGRLGLIGPRVGAVVAHQQLARMVPEDLVLDFHILLIRHGRTLCSARSPQCEECPLWDLCPDGQQRMRTL